MPALMAYWQRLFCEERPSIGLSFFRIAVAVTVGAHVLPSFFHLDDNYFSTAFKVLNTNFFPAEFVSWVGRSPDFLVGVVVAIFCVSWFFFLIGLWAQVSCIALTLSCYYFYALNSFPIGTLSWDILLVTLFLMCLTPYHGDYFSIDALRSGDIQAYRRSRPFFVQGLLQMQIAFTYFYTGLVKITAAGNWVTENPIYVLMNYPVEGVMKTFLLKDFLAGHPALCYAIGLAVVACELSMPVLLYWSKTRLSAIALGILFHITLLLTMDVPAIFFFLFPPQLLLFIPPEDVVAWIDNKRRLNHRAGQSLLVYDGHCSFCRGSVRQLKIMDLFDTLALVDYQVTPDLDRLHPSLTREAAHSRIHLVEPDGALYEGFQVMRRMCFNLPMLFPMLFVFYFPGSGIVGPAVYRWVAKNRTLFHTSKACLENACFPDLRRGSPEGAENH